VGWVSEGVAPSRKGGSGVSPRKIFEFTDAKSCILAHFDIKNYLLQTHQCSRKEKDLLQRSSSGPSLKLEPKTWGIEAHPSPAPKLLGDVSLHLPGIAVVAFSVHRSCEFLSYV
jgi:hypothetical protein